MKKTEFPSCFLSPAWMICTFLLGLSAPAHAIPQLDALGKEQISVRELMRRDTEQALKLARERADRKTVAAEGVRRVSGPMSGEPRLMAIYGVGHDLMAEVIMDEITYLYRRGQALPVGVAAGAQVYMLHKISPSCIELKRSEDSHYLCLRPSRWVVQ